MDRNRDRVQPGRWNVIMADSPWAFETYSEAGTDRSPKYQTMTTADICRLRVPDLAAEDSVLLLWVTDPRLPDGLEVIRAWGFVYKTVGFYWVKLTKSGLKLHMGQGYHTRANVEICLLATRGQGLRRVDKAVERLIVSPLERHSKKPDEVYSRVERLYGDVPRIELFARQRWPGWSAFGNEVISDVELGSL